MHDGRHGLLRLKAEFFRYFSSDPWRVWGARIRHVRLHCTPLPDIDAARQNPFSAFGPLLSQE